MTPPEGHFGDAGGYFGRAKALKSASAPTNQTQEVRTPKRASASTNQTQEVRVYSHDGHQSDAEEGLHTDQSDAGCAGIFS
eukprot:3754323-Pyramimonas_sp.AAC.2